MKQVGFKPGVKERGRLLNLNICTKVDVAVVYLVVLSGGKCYFSVSFVNVCTTCASMLLLLLQ